MKRCVQRAALPETGSSGILARRRTSDCFQVRIERKTRIGRAPRLACPVSRDAAVCGRVEVLSLSPLYGPPIQPSDEPQSSASTGCMAW
jgi:hypothetical protein